MRRIIRFIRQPAWILAGLALAGGAPAQEKPTQDKPVQEKPAPEAKPFFETAQVNLINVEVFVTDRAGNPVTGLKPEDFEVLEDGRHVNVTNFYAAEPSAPSVAQAAPGGPPETSAPESPALPPVEQRLSVVVFVDNSGITGADRNLALRHAHELLATCLEMPRTQAMVATLDLRAHVRQEFTTDLGLLDAALAKVKAEPADPTSGAINTMMIERAMDRISLPSQPTDLRGSTRRGGAESVDFAAEEARSILDAIRSTAEASFERTRAMMASMSSFVASLAGFPGRKVVFYIGNGISLQPGESLLLKWEKRFGSANLEPGFSAPLEASRSSLSTDFRGVIARANADRVMFYAIDARGSAPLTGPTAEQAVLDPEPGTTVSEEMGKQQSLAYLASATGGTTIASTPGASPALALALKDLQTYYSLGYPAPRMGDGKDHVITVKVRREGVKVRYRTHYLDKTADERVIERNLSALLHNSGSNSLDVDVSVGTPSRRDSGTFVVPLLVTVPLGKLVLLPEGDAHRGSVTMFIAAKDLDDRITPPVKRVFPITIPDERLDAALGQNARFVFEMVMTRGPQTVAVSVRDDLAAVESTVTARFSVIESANQVTIQNQGS
jgi:VWFA-related protein